MDGHGQGTLVPPSARLALDELLRHTREIVEARDGLWRLIEAIVSVASADLTLSSVLKRVVEVARDMVDAEYAALGVIAEHGGLCEFVHVGMEPDTVEQIGHLPEGQGILGVLISEPQMLRLEELADHPASVGFPRGHPPMDSFLGVPIEVRGQVYGNLYLTNCNGGHGFTDDDVELVRTLAAAAGVAIDNARLHEEALRRGRWLEATRDLTGELLSGAETQQVEALITARARELSVAATATLVGLCDDGLVVVAAAGLYADDLQGRRFRWDRSISADVLETERAFSIDDLSADPRQDQPLAGVAGLGPAMFVPLLARGRRLGTLGVAREKGQPPFTASELRAAEGFAAQAALALDYRAAQAERWRTAVLDERERIGHDIHDLVIQRLFATGLALDNVIARIDDPLAGQSLLTAVEQIDAAIADLRSSIFGLHARRQGTSTVRHQVEAICDAAAPTLGFVPEYDLDPAVDVRVSDEVVTDLLAVTRETLTNVARHATAERVMLTLQIVGPDLYMEVVDDGRGIPSTGRRSGLNNMLARAVRLGGSMDVLSSEDGGTRIRWSIPIGDDERAPRDRDERPVEGGPSAL